MSKKMMMGMCGVALMLACGTVLQAAIWTGGTSTEWTVGSNWNTGSKPSSGDDVTLEAQTNDPVVSSAEQLRALNMGGAATGSGAGPTLTITNGGSLLFGARGPNIYEGTITVQAGASFSSAWEFFLGGPLGGFETRTTLNISGDVAQPANPHQVRLGNGSAAGIGQATVNLNDGTFYVNDLIFNKNTVTNGGNPDSHIFITAGELRLPDSFEYDYDFDWADDEIQAVAGRSLVKRVEGGYLFVTAEIPEPAALSLIALGGLALLLRRRR